MTTFEDMMEHVKWHQENRCEEDPIFQILLIEHPDEEWMLNNDGQETPSGFPDTGDTFNVGFFYSLQDAIHAVETNCCDMQEGIYHAAFIQCLFPGLYSVASKNARMYFVWDTNTKTYLQKEEPGIFEHYSVF